MLTDTLVAAGLVLASYVAVDCVVSECTGERAQTARFVDYAAPKVAQGASYLRDEATIRAAQFKARFSR